MKMDFMEKQEQDNDKGFLRYMPREGIIIEEILKDMGFEEYDPR